jgi:hypothetical protein
MSKINSTEYGLSEKSVFTESAGNALSMVVIPIHTALALETIKSPRFEAVFGKNGNIGELQRLAKAFPNREMPKFIAQEISSKAQDMIERFNKSSNKYMGDIVSTHNIEHVVDLTNSISGNINDIFQHNVYDNNTDVEYISRLMGPTSKPTGKTILSSAVKSYIESIYSIFPHTGDEGVLSFLSSLSMAV